MLILCRAKTVYFNGPNLMLKSVQECAGHPVYPFGDSSDEFVEI